MQQSLKAKTMRRVLAVYYLRKVLNPFTVKAGILALGAVAFGSLVHVAKVFENMPALTDISGMASFGIEAFVNTEIAVQSVLVLLGVFTLWLARDVIRAFIPETHKLQLSHS